MNKRKYGVVIASILLMSLGLQLLTINSYSFWFDESYTSSLLRFPATEVISLTGADVHPPLYYLVLKVWSSILGTSDVALRSLSAILMTLSLVVLSLVVRRLVDRKAAVYATVFAAVGPFVIRYAQEARMYGLSSLCILGSTLVLIRNVQSDRQQWRWWFLYALLITACLYTHYFSALIILAHGAYFIIQADGSLKARVSSLDRGWVMAFIVSIVLYLPWVPTLLTQLQAVNAGFWIPGVSVASFADTISQIVAFFPLSMQSNWFLLIAAFSAIACIGYAVTYVVRKQKKMKTALVLLIGPVVIVSIVLFAVSLLPFISSYYYLRYFSQYAVLFYGGLGVLVFSLMRTSARRFGIVLGAVIIASQLFGTYRVMIGVDKTENQTKQLMQQFHAQHQPGDYLLTSRFFNYYDVHHYNRSSSMTMLVQTEESYGSLQPIFRTDGAVVSFSFFDKPGSRIWYVSGVADRIEPPKEWKAVREPVILGGTQLELFELLLPANGL